MIFATLQAYGIIPQVRSISRKGSRVPGNIIPGIKLIRYNLWQINHPDDPSYPYKLEGTFRPEPGLDIGLVAMMRGREEFVVRAKTREALAEFVERNGYIGHPRLLTLKLTGPRGFIKMWK